VVSTMGVLYHVGDAGDETAPALREALRDTEHGFTPLVAAGFLKFVLLYTPCVVAILTMRRELGARWMAFDVGYQMALAWLMAFAVHQVGRALGWG